MTQVRCTLTGTAYQVKKVIKYGFEMPKNASYYATAYNGQEPVINIYRTPGGAMYAKPSVS